MPKLLARSKIRSYLETCISCASTVTLAEARLPCGRRERAREGGRGAARWVSAHLKRVRHKSKTLQLGAGRKRAWGIGCAWRAKWDGQDALRFANRHETWVLGI